MQLTGLGRGKLACQGGIGEQERQDNTQLYYMLPIEKLLL